VLCALLLHIPNSSDRIQLLVRGTSSFGIGASTLDRFCTMTPDHGFRSHIWPTLMAYPVDLFPETHHTMALQRLFFFRCVLGSWIGTV
jgi:hypothetical protein